MVKILVADPLLGCETKIPLASLPVREGKTLAADLQDQEVAPEGHPGLGGWKITPTPLPKSLPKWIYPTERDHLWILPDRRA